MKAAGVNPADWKILEGYMQQMIQLQFPSTLGMDFSGFVKQIGEGDSSIRQGDEAYGQASVFTGGSGAFAEMALANTDSIAHKPKSLSHVEAAALPLVGVSAWQAIVENIGLSKDQKILIHGGAGGIGSIAIQLAKYLDAYIATNILLFKSVSLRSADTGSLLTVMRLTVNLENQILSYLKHCKPLPI